MARSKFSSASSRFKLSAADGLQQVPKADGVNAVKRREHIKYCMAARRSAPGTGGFKLKRRKRPGFRALKEIVEMQKTVDLLIPKVRFRALVREIGWDYKTDLMWGAGSVEVIQEAAEAYLIRILEAANYAAIHAKREQIMVKDLKLAISMQRLLRGD